MIIIGNGRVGGGLKLRAERLGSRVTCLGRNDSFGSLMQNAGKPILVCTNAGDLAEVIHATPTRFRPDLVFIQNGMLDTFLTREGLSDSTRGLLYFAVPKRGVEPQPGGASIFSGPHAEVMTEFFRELGLEARCVSRQDFSNEMASKLIWNCVFGLLSDVLDCPVGTICIEHRASVDGLVAELVSICNAGIQTTLEANATSEDLVAYSMSIPEYQGALKQWEWRNGWFDETAGRLGIDTPLHDKFLVGRRPTGR